MAVATEQSSVVRTATGLTTSFPVPFPFASSAHLVVTLAGVLQVLGTHYTVTGAGTGSGEVTMLVAPPAGAEVTIERTVPLVQTTALRSAGTFSPEVHEAALDYRAMAEQQLARRIEVVSADVDQLAGDLADGVADLNAADAALTGRADAADTAIAGLAGQAATFGGQLDTLVGRANGVDARLDGIVVDIAEAALPDGSITAAKLADEAVTLQKRAETHPYVSEVRTASTTSAGTYVDIGTGLFVTLPTLGRSVVLTLESAGGPGSVGVTASASGQVVGRFGLSIDGDAGFVAELDVGALFSGAGYLRWPASAIRATFVHMWWFNFPIPGTYTFRLRYQRVTGQGADSVDVSNVRLVAYEL